VELPDALEEPAPVVMAAVLTGVVGHRDEPHALAQHVADRLQVLQLRHGVGETDPVEVRRLPVDRGGRGAVDVRVNVYDPRRRRGQPGRFGDIVQTQPIGRRDRIARERAPRLGFRHPPMIGDLAQFRIALAHDWLVGMRGGERVLDRLARLFGPTDLYTLVSDGRPLSEAISACRVRTSPLQRAPGARGRWRRHYLPLMPWAVGRLRVAPCDLLISTSSAVMKSIRPPPRAPHLCYCHSPARYVWAQTAAYAARPGTSGGLVRWAGLRAVRRPFQRWDRMTASRVTRFLANSAHTAQLIRSCFGREAHVVHPPARTGWFTVDPAVKREPWLLVVAALEPYKRTELAVEAANRGGFHLKVAGAGSQLDVLRAAAGPTVEILGRQEEPALRDLYRRARALLFPQVEDFGITAVEAQATGCPVVALAAGGARDIVTDATGVLFETQTAEALLEAVEALNRVDIDPASCRLNAERFSEEAFDRAILEHVRALL
jgi:glycosyltransferase involved in cell wall biosynthesis